MAANDMRSVASLFMILNFAMYATLLGLCGWAMNRAIDLGFVIGPGLELPAHFSPIYFPMGNAATGFFVVFSLIAGVVGVASTIAGFDFIRSWNSEGRPGAASAAVIAWALTLLSMGIGCLDLEWKKILEELTELPNIKNIWIIVKKVVYAAGVYFIWQERNLRLFQSIKREWEVLWKAIEENVKLKISSLMVLKSVDVEDVYNVWGIEGDKDLSI